MIMREQEGGVLTLMLNRPEVGNALSPEIVTAMEGTIDVTTEPGTGTTFTVTLPLRVSPPSSRA